MGLLFSKNDRLTHCWLDDRLGEMIGVDKRKEKKVIFITVFDCFEG